ncbi:AAA family ATPase [Verrucomicrobiaceae bacterium 5K15]|uniref:AAA family ATPase n=1 Tax=Oceaniferula flava TaxID=2800421 RepID=A0AAE2VA55_9BACT|nr:AAA family ATPase [Oceaniferula flavus]MBK1856333.1 AAA family ATPase [Oceaniferula flavus]MBM1137640.1 AAA family ATPase [Oceaniferula flavus]
MRAIITGNSGSGKSTLAKRLAENHQMAHLDLDTLAWNGDTPPARQIFSKSTRAIDDFLTANKNWVIEGCYADLIRYAAKSSTHFYFMNLPTETCLENCRNRPWEAHKYPSPEAQNAMLEMLLQWVRDYTQRDDDFSYQSHRDLFDAFNGSKFEILTNQQAAALTN